MAKSGEACNRDLNVDYKSVGTDYMPPRNPKSVLYTVKNTISPDKKRTCLEMKSSILHYNVLLCEIRHQHLLCVVNQYDFDGHLLIFNFN